VLNILLHRDDFLFSHHRSHGYYLAKNCSLNKLVAELYGKVCRANKSLVESQNISSTNENFYAGAILSGSIEIAVGVAYRLKLKNKEVHNKLKFVMDYKKPSPFNVRINKEARIFPKMKAGDTLEGMLPWPDRVSLTKAMLLADNI
jgi:hypothetical protein